jgi:hypothetical protein
MTMRTKVGWGHQIDFSSWKNIVFFEGWGRAGMLGLHFVLGVRNAHTPFLFLALFLLGRSAGFLRAFPSVDPG